MGLLTTLGDLGAAGLIASFVAAVVAVVAVQILYKLYLHPLSGYPGPRLAAATRLWYCYHTIRGDTVYTLDAAHEKYGDVIRVAPNELSYTDPNAWADIYGHRAGKPELTKDPTFYSSIGSSPGSIISADRSRHGALRKQASHGFSERALRSQEHVIQKYADLFIERLSEMAASKNPTIDIVDWSNFFTFDVMGDLVFGQSFGCLTNWGYYPWVRLIFDSGSYCQVHEVLASPRTAGELVRPRGHPQATR